jgi:ATP-dependent DNA helicase RecG
MSSEMSEPMRVTVGKSVDTTGKSKKTTGKTKKTTGKAALLMEQVRRNPQITTPELAVLLGLTLDGVTYHLRKLQKDGLLKRTGGRKSGHWEIPASANNSSEAGRAEV